MKEGDAMLGLTHERGAGDDLEGEHAGLALDAELVLEADTGEPRSPSAPCVLAPPRAVSESDSQRFGERNFSRCPTYITQ
jgi:hypothetical protein